MYKAALPIRWLVGLVVMSSFFPLHAVDITWIGTTNNLTLNTNWFPDITPGAGDSALFDGAVAISTNPTLLSTFDVLDLEFVGAPANFLFSINGENDGIPAIFTIGAGGAGGGVFLSTADEQNFIIFNGATLNFINNSSADANFNGSLTYSVFPDLFGTFPNTLLFTSSVAGNANIFCSGGFVSDPLVRFENNSNAQTAAINISLNGVLEFDDSSAGSSTIDVSGSAATFQGNSTADLSTINVNQGTVNFFDDSSLGDSTINLFNGTLTFDSTAAISTADVSMANASAMQVNQDLTISSLIADMLSKVVISNSTLTVGDETSTMIGAQIQGPNGNFRKRGSGTVTLTGVNTYTGNTFIDEGTLVVSVINLPPNGDIANIDGTLSFVQNDNATFLGRFLAGQGTVIKTGLGTLTLSNDCSGFSGLTSVMEGALRLKNVLGGDVIVDQTGTLSGTGQILGNLSVIGGGTVAPSNSIGRLDIGGNYQQGPSATYEAEVDGNGNSDLINILGSAALNGTLVIGSVDGIVNSEAVYTILHANGGVMNVFSNIIVTNPLFIAHIVYLPNDVQLTFQHLFSAIADTDNQSKVAEQLQSITNPTPEEQAILTQLTLLATSPETIDEARRALSQMSGEQYTNSIFTAEISGRQFIRRLYAALRPHMIDPSLFEDDCYYTTYEEDGCYYLAGDPWRLDTTSYSIAPWLEISGGHSLLPRNSQASGFSMNNYQITLGLQGMPGSCWTFGIAGSYEYEHIDYNLGGTGNNNIGLFGLYGLFRPRGFYVLADLVYGFGCNQVKRPIEVGNISLNAKGKPFYQQGIFYIEAGKDFDCDRFLWQPFFGIEVAYFAGRKFSESGAGPLNLKVRDKYKTNVFSRLGLHVFSEPIYCWSLNLDIAWVCRLTSTSNRLRENFKDFGEPFTIRGVSLPRNSLEGIANLSAKVCNNWIFFAELSGEKWSRGSSYSVLGGVQYTW